MLAEVLVPQVFGDLAQPDGNLAAPVNPPDGADRLAKGPRGQLLRQVRVMALGQEELVDGLGVLTVNGAHIIHRGPSFHPLYPLRAENVTENAGAGEISSAPACLYAAIKAASSSAASPRETCPWGCSAPSTRPFSTAQAAPGRANSPRLPLPDTPDRTASSASGEPTAR